MTDQQEQYMDDEFHSEDSGVDIFNEVIDIEDGIYDAVITAHKTGMTTDWETQEPKPEYVWRFAVERAPGDTVELYGYTSRSRNVKSKLTEWLVAIFGAKYMNELNRAVDYQNDVVGLAVRVKVGHGQQSGKPKVTDIIEARK